MNSVSHRARDLTLMLLLVVVTSPVLGAERERLAVLPPRSDVVEESVLTSLTAVLSAELTRTGRFDVLTAQDVESLLDFESLRDELECDETSCVAAIGGALGVDHILTTHVGLAGAAWILDVAIIDIERARSQARAYETLEAGPQALIEAARRAVLRLLEPRVDVAVAGPPVLAMDAETPPWIRLGWAVAGVGAVAIATGAVLRHQAGGPDGPWDGRRIAGEALLWTGVVTTVGGLLSLGLK